jgi:glutathione S-transferase
MAETPTLFVCHGDDGGPRIHPCRRVQEALRASGIEYDKVIAAHGNPIPFLRKGSRDELREATGGTKLPALKLPDGTVITHSRAIFSWIDHSTSEAGQWALPVTASRTPSAGPGLSDHQAIGRACSP